MKVGILASGKVISLNDLSPGDHTITFTAEDSDGNVGSASINIIIFSVQDSDGDKIGDDNDIALLFTTQTKPTPIAMAWEINATKMIQITMDILIMSITAH